MSRSERWHDGERPDRILTIPNVITVVRLLCLPVFLWLLFDEENRAAAAWLLGVLGATDFVDGYIARHFNQVSELGKILDPVADRLLFFVGVGAILIDGSVPAVVRVGRARSARSWSRSPRSCSRRSARGGSTSRGTARRARSRNMFAFPLFLALALDT